MNYKIYIKKSSSKNYYEPYAVESEDYVTDNLADLAEKYVELLEEYPNSQLKAVQELEAELLVNISES